MKRDLSKPARDLGTFGRVAAARSAVGPVGLAVGLMLPSVALSAAPTGFELMKRADALHRLPLERTESVMLLQKKEQKARERRVVQLTVQDDKKGDRMRVRFEAPANVRGTATLSVEDKPGGDEEQWLYLPAFRRSRRIGTAELGDRFAGTDFYYEDMKRREVEDFKYKILRSEKLDGHDCWVIESRPSAPKVVKESPYGKSIIWLRKDNLFVVRVRAFDRRMRALKEIRQSKLTRVAGKAWRSDFVTVVDVRRQHRTVVRIVKRQTKLEIDPNTFSKHKLADPI